jgi:DNA-directed RNA polymerase subunit RPC12/RpoP
MAMPTQSTNPKSRPQTVYNALKCKRCSRPILFDDDASKHSDPFEATCQACRHTALYPKRQLLLVRVSDKR